VCAPVAGYRRRWQAAGRAGEGDSGSALHWQVATRLMRICLAFVALWTLALALDLTVWITWVRDGIVLPPWVFFARILVSR
jgi:hypothetical protein